MREAVQFLQEYMKTYSDQHGYEYYSDNIFIDDVLYGLGVALHGDQAKFHKGYEWFKERLREHLSID